MRICHRTQGRLIALMCILLVVACTSVIFLPHSHEMSFDSQAQSHGLFHFDCAICVALVALLHLWKRNTLLSILLGTASYMLLVQLIF